MNNLNGFDKLQNGSTRMLRRMAILGSFVLGALMAMGTGFAYGQSAESANAGGVSLWAGAGASGYYVQFGEQKLLGITGFVDADSIRRFGIEGEGRWLEYHQFQNVHVETYMVGPRYHFNVGRFQPYVKALAGAGEFHYTQNFATDSDLVVAPGAGVDYRLSRRWSIRIADAEVQYWPQFHYGAMTSVGVTTGIRYRVF
jgi:hypothetical protein